MAVNMGAVGKPGKLVLRDVAIWKVEDVRWTLDGSAAEIQIQFWAGNPDADPVPVPAPKPWGTPRFVQIINGDCTGWKRKADADSKEVNDVLERHIVNLPTALAGLGDAYFKVPTNNANPRARAHIQVEGWLIANGVMHSSLDGA